MKALVIVLISACLGFGACNENNGIVGLEGYPHGVVICGEAMVINDGHLEDPEVKELINLAKIECPKVNN